MSGKRARIDERQVTWQWIDPEELLEAEEERGEVVFEATDASRIARSRPPRLPKVRVRRRGAAAHVEPESVGLPFGARAHEGRIVCWSCAQELPEGDAIVEGPGTLACPGCGARLPFA
jgi:hypothetical protein